MGINGFGRIGRMVMRVATEHSCPLEVRKSEDEWVDTISKTLTKYLELAGLPLLI